MEWLTTTILLDQLTRGESGAWEVFVTRFKRPILALGVKAGLAPDLAEDAAQECLLTLVRGLKDGSYSREKGRLSGWLFGIARFKVLQSLDLMNRRRADGLDDSGRSGGVSLPDARTLEESWEGSWAENVLHFCIETVRGEVDEKTFAAFEAVTLGDESIESVAQRLGMTPNAVSIAKHRVMKRMRALKADFETI